MGRDVDGAELRAQLGKMRGAGSGPHHKLVLLSDTETVSLVAQQHGCAVLVLPRESGQNAQRSNPIFGRLKCPRILV